MVYRDTSTTEEARQFVRRQGLDPRELDWCTDQLRAWHPSAGEWLEVRPVPSRLASVFRLVARTADGESAFFFKSYGASQPRDALSERFRLLGALQHAFERSSGVLPLQVVGSCAERGYLLTREVPGRPLLQIHCRMTRRLGLGERRVAMRAWRGVGEWLRTLHWKLEPTVVSAARVAKLADYTRDRFGRWASYDRERAGLSRDAIAALEAVALVASRRPATMTPCHGDLNVGNVLVGERVAVIDPDDMRLDMPGVDVSNALLEMREYAHVAGLLSRHSLGRSIEAAFREGYGHPLPGGPEYWLPHMRNLAVNLLTLAHRSGGRGLDRLTERARYRRAIAEFERCVADVRQWQALVRPSPIRSPGDCRN